MRRTVSVRFEGLALLLHAWEDLTYVPTHFVNRVDEVTFRARNVQMTPLELEELVFEMFEKDDANHDPLLQFDFGHLTPPMG